MELLPEHLFRFLLIAGLVVAPGCRSGSETGNGDFDFRTSDGAGTEDGAGGDSESVDSGRRDTAPESDGDEFDTGDLDEGMASFVRIIDFCKNTADHRIDVGLPSDTGPGPFSPAELTVGEETVVRWKNQTFGRHTIVNRTPAHARGEYFSEHLAGGEDTFCVEFGELPDRAGDSMTIRYDCSRHSTEGAITVEK